MPMSTLLLHNLRMRKAFIAIAAVAVAGAVSCTAWFGGRAEPPEGVDPELCRRAPTSGAAIRWVEEVDEKDRDELGVWCATVGPTVTARYADSRGQMPVVQSIAFVTWNIHVGGGDIAALLRDLRNGVLTGGTPPGHVVLLLQEAYRELYSDY